METELWLVDLDSSAAALEAIEAATPRLSDDVLGRLRAMRDADIRRERRQAHITLRLMLERRLGSGIRRLPFETNAAGKPLLPVPGASFSLAHTKGLALIAIRDSGPIGVDIERLRPVRMPERRRAPIESKAIELAHGSPLAGPDPASRFLNAWVRIEAAAKAHGGGIGPMLERLRPERREGPEQALRPGEDAQRLVVYDLAISDDVFAAVALPPSEGSPPLRTLPATVAAIESLLAEGPGTKH